MYQEKPSRILHIEDKYLAFCFDEACFYIRNMLEERDEDGNLINTPTWIEDKKKKGTNTQNNSDLITWMQKHL